MRCPAGRTAGHAALRSGKSRQKPGDIDRGLFDLLGHDVGEVPLQPDIAFQQIIHLPLIGVHVTAQDAHQVIKSTAKRPASNDLGCVCHRPFEFLERGCIVI